MIQVILKPARLTIALELCLQDLLTSKLLLMPLISVKQQYEFEFEIEFELREFEI